MSATGDEQGVSFLGRRLSSRFRRRVITVHPGQKYGYDPAEWQDAIAVVERGELELEDLHGRRGCRLRAGDVLWLAGLPVVALHPIGREQLVLTVVSRWPPRT